MITNGSLAKLASDSRTQEAYGTENRSVLNIHEYLSTGATKQLPTESEFCKGSNVGYARVSSTGQTLSVQQDKLKHCAKIYEEKKSGTTFKLPILEQCLDFLKKGDTLVVTRLDRLARSTLHLCCIAEILKNKGVELQVIDQNINTSDATGKLLFNILREISQFEMEIRAERQREGIKKAKEKGIQFGRKPKLSNKEIANLQKKREEGRLIKDLMKEFSLSKASVYRFLNNATSGAMKERHIF